METALLFAAFAAPPDLSAFPAPAPQAARAACPCATGLPCDCPPGACPCPGCPDRAKLALPPGALRTNSGEWIVPDPARPGGYIPLNAKPATAPGVAVARPFAPAVPPSTRGTAAPAAGTNPLTVKTAAPGPSRVATATPPTTTAAPGAALSGDTKFAIAEWHDAQGNKWTRYSDGSTVICSAFG